MFITSALAYCEQTLFASTPPHTAIVVPCTYCLHRWQIGLGSSGQGRELASKPNEAHELAFLHVDNSGNRCISTNSIALLCRRGDWTLTSDAPLATRTTLVEDLVYNEQNLDGRQTLDLFLPDEATNNRILLVYIHGGAWTERSKSGYRHLGVYYADHGYSTALVEYRLSLPFGQEGKTLLHPEHTRDCAHALVWLYEHAQEYGYNKDKLVIVGHSAGAFMAALLRIQPHYFQSINKSYSSPSQIIRGIVGLQGIFDLADMLKDSPTYLDWVVRPVFGDGDATAYEQASPTYLLKASPIATPAFLLIHSTHDDLLKITQTSRFFDKLSATAKDMHLTTLLHPEDARLSHNNIVDNVAGGHELVAGEIFAFAKKVCAAAPQ